MLSSTCFPIPAPAARARLETAKEEREATERPTRHCSYLARDDCLSSCHCPDHMIRLRKAGRSE
jgi:hypothetical protein